jgi:hypothetical protein
MKLCSLLISGRKPLMKLCSLLISGKENLMKLCSLLISGKETPHETVSFSDIRKWNPSWNCFLFWYPEMKPLMKLFPLLISGRKPLMNLSGSNETVPWKIFPLPERRLVLKLFHPLVSWLLLWEEGEGGKDKWNLFVKLFPPKCFHFPPPPPTPHVFGFWYYFLVNFFWWLGDSNFSLSLYL